MNESQSDMNTPLTDGQDVYALCGVLVHMGQANAGHYLSYARERRDKSSRQYHKWYKFNDTDVTEVRMID